MKTKLHQRGAALVVVLPVIILAVVLVVGMTVAMRMERSAAHFDGERTQAEYLARIGIDYGQALLCQARTTPPVGPEQPVGFRPDNLLGGVSAPPLCEK